MKMSKGGSVVDHLNEFNTVTNQLSSVKVEFDDEVRALLILCSFPESWNSLVMVVSNSVSCSNTLNLMILLVLSLVRKCDRKAQVRHALNMENRERQKDRGKGSGNHGNYRKGRSKSRLGKIECWNCGKKGNLKTVELQRNKEMEKKREIMKQM